MIRMFLMSLLMAISLFLSALFGQPTKTTTWKGTLDAGGTQLRLEIDITADGDKLTGELRSLDQNNAKLKMADIKTKGGELSFSIPQIGATFSGKYTKDGRVAAGTFTQSGRKLPLSLTKSESKPAAAKKKSSDDSGTQGKSKSADKLKEVKETLKEAWYGELEMGIMKPVMQFRIVTLAAGETSAYFDSVTEGQTGFKATWSIKGDKLNFDVPKIKLTYRGTLNEAGDTASGTWSQGGRKLPLTLKKHATVYDTVNVWKNRPQRPVGPFPYDAEEVTFANKADDLTLAGTLTIPKKPGKHPAVILISGSGPSDRDESIMEHKPFLVLADYLTRRGIAVLRYDDRGTGKSTGKFGPATTEDFARDASAAVEFLKNHQRINAKEIGLAGHSEGGLIAPMVVGLRDDVAFVCLLAATGVDGQTIVITQTEAMLRAAGIDEAEIKLALAINRVVIAAAAKAEPGVDFTKDLGPAIDKIVATIPESEREEAGKKIRASIGSQRKRLQGNWMRFFLSYDPRLALKKIKCPVLAIIGSKDTQVLPDLNMPEIKKALTEGGNKDFEMIEIEGLNHLFQKCETGSLGEYVTIQETFNPQALKTIGDWISKRITPVK